MTSLYEPAEGAQPDGTTFIAQLSLRDLSLQIPVNFVSLPGVALSQACFAHDRYEDAPAARCLSNLLAIGFRRLVVDVYWDVSRHVWSLCPVELGIPDRYLTSSSFSPPASSTEAAVATTVLGADSGTTTTTSALLLGREGVVDFLGAASLAFVDVLRARQTATSLSAGRYSFSASSLPSVSTTATFDSNASTTVFGTFSSGLLSSEPPGEQNSTLIQVGPYLCTTTMTLPLLGEVIQEHLSSTEDSLNATTKYVILNLHVAAPSSNPYESPQTPAADDMPQGSNLLSNIISSNVSEYLYTPTNLREQRSNLNASSSWYQVTRADQPDESYFTVKRDGDIYYTTDGWPSEGFVELQKAKRLFAGFGTVDEQITGYNFSGDASTIFPEGYLYDKRDVTLAADGVVESGCFFRDGVDSVAAVNSSWATSADGMTSIEANRSIELVRTTSTNMTNCGISPILNETLGNVTADQDYTPYQDYVLSTVWAWARGQPSNTSQDPDGQVATQKRCAVLNSTSGYWETEHCNTAHFAACRYMLQPYNWTISKSEGAYSKVGGACPESASFATPRTALENQYLLHVWRRFQPAAERNDPLLYVNFNDLDVDTCWVIGQNTTCPYVNTSDDHERTVVVPVVASVIVFVLFVLTLFVKCAANRQYSRRKRRRGYDPLDDYEGVPI